MTMRSSRKSHACFNCPRVEEYLIIPASAQPIYEEFVEQSAVQKMYFLLVETIIKVEEQAYHSRGVLAPIPCGFTSAQSSRPRLAFDVRIMI